MVVNEKTMFLMSVFLVCFFAVSPDIYAGTYRAESCSYSDVSTAIASASSGDTVSVPPGSCTWNSNITITKGIILLGAGAGVTTITGNITPVKPGHTSEEGNFLIVYKPTDPASNEPFRLSGFTMDFDNKSSGILLKNKSTTAINQIRMDHNAILNATMVGGSARAVMADGTVYGVIDNNTFSGNAKHIDVYGNQRNSWDNLTFAYGSADNIYYEDNTFAITWGVHSTGKGGRYVARYNTYNISVDSNLYPWFDAHGNQDATLCQSYATMGVEIYGNIMNAGSHGVGIFDHRGGKGIIFNNTVNTTGSVSAKVREEYADNVCSTTNPQPQHVSDAYYWNNTKNGTAVINATEEQDCCNAIAENSEFYNQNADFDGTAGVGIGVLASRPATCTPGVGYWATDQGGDWNKNNTTSNDGTLYKCTSSDTWTVYYTPYTYPHPLRVAPAKPEKLY